MLTCHLCFVRKTRGRLSLRAKPTLGWLPVCTVCIRPWHHNKECRWLYNIHITLNGKTTQRKPTVKEVRCMLGLIALDKACYSPDIETFSRCILIDHERLFEIHALQDKWDEGKQRYIWKGHHDANATGLCSCCSTTIRKNSISLLPT